jgi:hypothetical protein
VLDPYRNTQQDVAAALEHALDAYAGLDHWPDDACFIEKRGLMAISKIANYDDLGSWAEWRSGELRGLSRDELFAEFKAFRGQAWATSAMSWIAGGWQTGGQYYDNIPAIVIFDSKRFGQGIADGRGRTSIAVGLKIPRLYVTKIVDCEA